MGQWVYNHYNNADEYAVSGWPWVKTGDLTEVADLDGGDPEIIEIDFPAVLRFLVIHNVSDSPDAIIHVAFANAEDNTPPLPLPDGKIAEDYRAMGFYTSGTTDQYFVLGVGEITPALEIKCKKIYLRAVGADAKYSIVAGYTNIPASTFPNFEKYRRVFTGV
jgi:hypothetical protein